MTGFYPTSSTSADYGRTSRSSTELTSSTWIAR
nr:MAG TPA: hypothetical protein [Caudoviricetes sp.]